MAEWFRSRTQGLSLMVVLGCVGGLLLITACGFVPAARPSPQPETFVLREDSAWGHVLGHGTMRMTNSVRTRAEVVLYGAPGEGVETVNLEGLLVLTLPRHLVLHGSGGKETVQLLADTPNPLASDSASELLPLRGRLRLDGGAVTRQTQVRAEVYGEDRLRLQLAVTASNGAKTRFTLTMTLWPGDGPAQRHVAAELSGPAPCREHARSDESVITAMEGPFALELKTAQGGVVHVQFAEPLDKVRAAAGLGVEEPAGSITFSGGPCGGERYTLGEGAGGGVRAAAGRVD